MTYTQFKNKWLGKGIDFDGKYGNQCVDVYRMYCKEVLNIPQSPPVVGAKDIWNNYLKEHFTKIPNTPEGIPKQGDVMIWGMQPYGHIGIVDSATENKFTTFEQNWTELNGSGVTELRTHYYKNVLGWLTPKSVIINDMTEQENNLLKVIKEANLNEGDIRWLADNIYIKNNDTVKKLEEEITGLKATISEQYKEMDKKNLEYGKLLEDFNILMAKYQALQELESLHNDTIKDKTVIELIKIIIGKIFSSLKS